MGEIKEAGGWRAGAPWCRGLQSVELLWGATKASRSQEMRRAKHTERHRKAEEQVYRSKASPTNERVKARRRTGGLQRVR